MPGQQQLSSKRTQKWSTDAVEIAWYCAIYLKVFKCPNADKAVTHRINPATSSPGDRVSRHCLAAAPAHVRIDTAGKLATCPLSGFAKASKKSARWRMAWKSLALRGGGGAIAASSISTTPAAPRWCVIGQPAASSTQRRKMTAKKSSQVKLCSPRRPPRQPAAVFCLLYFASISVRSLWPSLGESPLATTALGFRWGSAIRWGMSGTHYEIAANQLDGTRSGE